MLEKSNCYFSDLCYINNISFFHILINGMGYGI